MSNAAIRQMESYLEDAESQILDLQKVIEGLQAAIAFAKKAEEEKEATATPAKEIRNSMVEILNEAGESLHYGEILIRLEQRGIEVPGKDPKKNVGAHLSIDDRFEKDGMGKWRLASWKKGNPFAPPDRNREVAKVRHNPFHSVGGSRPAETNFIVLEDQETEPEWDEVEPSDDEIRESMSDSPKVVYR